MSDSLNVSSASTCRKGFDIAKDVPMHAPSGSAKGCNGKRFDLGGGYSVKCSHLHNHDPNPKLKRVRIG